MVLLKLCLDYWDHDHIDTGDILVNLKKYCDYVYTIPNLPQQLSKEKIGVLTDVLKQKLS